MEMDEYEDSHDFLDKLRAARHVITDKSGKANGLTCDANGDVKVKIRDTVTKQENEHRLGRWSSRRKRTKRASAD